MFTQKLGSGSSTHSSALDLDGISRQQNSAGREKDGPNNQRDVRFDGRLQPNADIRRSKWPVEKCQILSVWDHIDVAGGLWVIPAS